MKTCKAGNEIVAPMVPFATFAQGDTFMAGILLWLMGVPLIVIILLYLIF
jgi:hypothetical protein